MCYEPLRFSPIFRRFVNSRESRVGFTADSSQPHNQKRLCSRTIVFVLWCVLDCFTQSRAFPQTTPPSLCILHTLYQTKHPSHLEHNLEAGSPLAGLPQNPTPGQHRAVGHTRTHPYRIYRAPVRLWRGCSQSRAFVFVSCLRLSLALGLVSLPRDEVLSRRDEVLSRRRQRFIY